MPDRRWATAAFAAAVAVSLVVLFAPHTPSEQGVPHVDKVVHALTFLLLATTTRWRFGGRGVLLAAVIAYGALSEVVQWLALADRDGDVRDFLADAVGALLGWASVRQVARQER